MFKLSHYKDGIYEKNEDDYLLNSVTIYSILRDKRYFSNLTLRKVNVHSISGPVMIIEGFRKAMIILHNGTILLQEDVLLSSRLKKNLFSFPNVRRNGYHFETIY